MATHKLYHGTDKQGYNSVMKNGFQTVRGNWNVSEPNTTYFWDSSKVDGDNAEECKDRAIYQALESASICAALHKQQGTELYVFEIELEEDLFQEDQSCENMRHEAVEVSNGNLRGVKATVYKSTDFQPSLWLFYLTGLKDNPYLNKCCFLSELEEMVLDNIQFRDTILDDIFSFDWKRLKTTVIK